MKAFVVIHPFGDYRRGDAITHLAEIATVLAGENAHHGHMAEHPDPKPEAAPAKAKRAQAAG